MNTPPAVGCVWLKNRLFAYSQNWLKKIDLPAGITHVSIAGTWLCAASSKEFYFCTIPTQSPDWRQRDFVPPLSNANLFSLQVSAAGAVLAVFQDTEYSFYVGMCSEKKQLRWKIWRPSQQFSGPLLASFSPGGGFLALQDKPTQVTVYQIAFQDSDDGMVFYTRKAKSVELEAGPWFWLASEDREQDLLSTQPKNPPPLATAVLCEHRASRSALRHPVYRFQHALVLTNFSMTNEKTEVSVFTDDVVPLASVCAWTQPTGLPVLVSKSPFCSYYKTASSMHGQWHSAANATNEAIDEAIHLHAALNMSASDVFPGAVARTCEEFLENTDASSFFGETDAQHVYWTNGVSLKSLVGSAPVVGSLAETMESLKMSIIRPEPAPSADLTFGEKWRGVKTKLGSLFSQTSTQPSPA